jgi:hypothetical protein
VNDAATKAVRTDPRTYTNDQLQGWTCALCGARLYATRAVGRIDVPTGYPGRVWSATLYACDPGCDPRAARHG